MLKLHQLMILGCVLFSLARAGAAEEQADSMSQVSASVAIDRALETSSLTYHGAPFHAVMQISDKDHKTSAYDATIEVSWAAPAKYRITTVSKDFQQVRVVNGDAVQEKNTGDFYPGWLGNYVMAIMNPLPRAEAFRRVHADVNVGAQVSNSCISIDDRPGGITDMMTWGQICFHGPGLGVASAIDFTYFMEFGDYKTFGNKVVAQTYTTYEDNNQAILGKLTKLEPLKSPDEKLFLVEKATPGKEQIETAFVSMATSESLLERAPVIQWPPVREGKLEGNMIVHVITDRTGQVRESEKHNSDNPGMEAAGRLEALKYKFKPLIVDGEAKQMETPLVIHFKTTQGDPLPVVTGADIEKYSSGCHYKPVLPAGLLPSGTSFKIRVSVNEGAKLTGETFPPNIPWEVVQKTGLDTHSCKFKPYIIDGNPWYHHIDFVFTAP